MVAGSACVRDLRPGVAIGVGVGKEAAPYEQVEVEDAISHRVDPEVWIERGDLERGRYVGPSFAVVFAAQNRGGRGDEHRS
jgi:hypothetical protein